jgi:hypothetical protein
LEHSCADSGELGRRHQLEKLFHLREKEELLAVSTTVGNKFRNFHLREEEELLRGQHNWEE